jgi:hypothetical protein
MKSTTGHQTSAAGSGVKAVHCVGCGAMLATTESPHDLYSWSYQTFRRNHVGTRAFCDTCS